MNYRSMVFCGFVLGFSIASQAATVTQIVSQTDFNWAAGADNAYGTADDYTNQWGQIDLRDSGTAAITTDFPHHGLGSVKLASNQGAAAKAGVAYYATGPDGFGPFSGISAASFDWMRSSSSDFGDNSPVMRIMLFTPGTDTRVFTILWSAVTEQILPITNDHWYTANVAQGTVWQSLSGKAHYNERMTFAAAQALPEFKDLTVRAIEVGFGTGDWGPNFVGAVDTVVFNGSNASVNANFEPPALPQPMAAAATPVPTLQQWALGLLGLGIAGVLGWRQRNRS